MGGGVSESSLIVWTFYLADKIPAAAVAAAAAQADKFAVSYAAFAHKFVFCFFLTPPLPDLIPKED